MPENQLVFGRIREALISSFPELWERIEKTFGSYYDPEEETPEAYPIFEDVVKKLMFELLQDDYDQALLRRLFRFFEDMANSPDPNVSRDLLGIAILEPLVYRQESIRRAWKYTGPRTRNLAMVEARSQSRLGNLPIESEDLKL
jgi:hypothetical protein